MTLSFPHALPVPSLLHHSVSVSPSFSSGRDRPFVHESRVCCEGATRSVISRMSLLLVHKEQGGRTARVSD